MKKQEIIEEVRQLKERLALLENQLKESQEDLEEKYVPWIPKSGEKYFYINEYGDIGSLITFNSGDVTKLSNNHNLFKTRELAEERRFLGPLERKLAFILDQLGRGEVIVDIRKTKFNKYTFSISDDNVFEIDSTINTQSRHKSQYATSKEMMEKAIELMGDDAYRYCGVEPPTSKRG